MKLFIIWNSFTADTDNSPTELQLELIDNQNEKDFKDVYRENDLLNFYNLYESAEKFQKLRHHAKKNVAYFGRTYCCKQFFSLMKLTKKKKLKLQTK